MEGMTTHGRLVTQEGIDIRSSLLAALAPRETNTYKPISHAALINSVLEFCDRKNVKVIKEQYKANQNRNQMLGIMTLDLGSQDLKYQIAFKNSYDRSMSLGFAAGGTVFICSNGVVVGEHTYVHRHQGNIVNELNDNLFNTYNTLDATFEVISSDLERFKSIDVADKLLHEMVGRMYLEEDILNTEQLQIFKAQSKDSEHFKEQSAYGVYNWTTEALKKSHPSNYLQKHVSLHNLFNELFK